MMPIIEQDTTCRTWGIEAQDNESVIAWTDLACHCDVKNRERNALRTLNITNKTIIALLKAMGEKTIAYYLRLGQEKP